MLTVMNIAPSQLYPISWAFLKCFELLCEHLGFKPYVNVFTHFYHKKFGKLVGLVSLSSTHNDSLFTMYSFSYKYFKINFFKLRCHLGDAERRLLFHPDFTPRFPLYWQKPTRFQPRFEHQLTPKERRAVEVIRQLPHPLNTRALLFLPLVEDPNVLFLGTFCPLCYRHRLAAFLILFL